MRWIALALCLASVPAFAQGLFGQGIAVSPTRVELDARGFGVVKVINNSADTVPLQVELMPLLDADKDVAKVGPLAWVKFSPATATLPPGARQVVRVLAAAPAGVESGVYRWRLRARAVPPVEQKETDALELRIVLAYAVSIALELHVP